MKFSDNKVKMFRKKNHSSKTKFWDGYNSEGKVKILKFLVNVMRKRSKVKTLRKKSPNLEIKVAIENHKFNILRFSRQSSKRHQAEQTVISV